MQKVISKKVIKKSISNKKGLNENSLKNKELQELSEALQNLDEATWGERLKYLAAEWLPSYKVGDKILGGEKERQKMLGKIQAIMDDEKQKGQYFIKSLDKELRTKFPKFPNNLEKEDFLKGVLEISAVYDTIKKAADDGTITPGAADIFINNLRTYVNYVMSYQLNRTVYSTMNEDYDESEDIQLGEATMADVDADGGLSSDSVRRALDRDRDARGGAAGYNEYDSEVMKGLKSNRLPLTLGLVGAVLTAAGWVGQCQWFIDYIKGLKEIDVWNTQDIIERNIKIDPRGLSYTLQNNLPANQALNLNFNQPVGNLKEAIKFYGNGDMKKGIEIVSNFIDPNQRAESVANLVKQLGDPSNTTIGDIFNTAEGTYGRAGTLFSQYGGAKAVFAKFFINRIKHTLIKQGAGAVLGTALIGAAPYLLPIGISAMVAGAVVKAMRVKGQTSSRAATLNALLQSLRDISTTNQQGGGNQGGGTTGGGTTGGGTTGGGTTGGGTTGGGTTGGGTTGGGTTGPNVAKPISNLMNVLRNLFINVNKVKQQSKLTTEADKRQNYLKRGGLDFTNLDKNEKTIFIDNMKRMVAVIKAVNRLNIDKNSYPELDGLLRNVRSNKAYAAFSDINTLIDKYSKSQPKLFISLIGAYNEAIKTTEFKNLKDEIAKNLPSVINEAAKPKTSKKGTAAASATPAEPKPEYEPTQQDINKVKLKRPDYLPSTEDIVQLFKELYKLFRKVNQIAEKASGTTQPTPEPGQQLKIPLGEDKNKKTKYSKKASSFIGKEISHLKKDKGYSQERAVAAAINVAKKKRMKVGDKINENQNITPNVNQEIANIFSNILKKPVTVNQINQIPTANKQRTQSANNVQTQTVTNEDFGASALGIALLLPTVLTAAGQFINFLRRKFGLSKEKQKELNKLNKIIQNKKLYIQKLDAKDSPKEFQELKKLENLYHQKNEEYGTLIGNSLQELGHSLHEIYIAPINYALTKASDTAVYFKMKQPEWLSNPQKRQYAANIAYSVLCLAFAGWQGYEHLKHLPGLTTTVVTVIKEGIEGGKSIKEIITSAFALI